MVKSRNFPATCVLKDKAFVLGGFKAYDSPRADIEVLDLVAERSGWELMAA